MMEEEAMQQEAFENVRYVCLLKLKFKSFTFHYFGVDLIFTFKLASWT